MFNNSGLSVLYKMTDNFDLGATVRRENFYLVYQGVENDKDYEYYQQPNFVSYALMSRYVFNRTGRLSPFIQSELGGNKYGYLGRMSLGAAINIYSNIALVLNLEGSMFMFQNEGQWFTAKKVGFEYGISYSF